MSDKFTILTVCTGNICRSPLGEQLLALGLANVPEVHVESAGTQALVGKGMTEQSQAIASSLGVAHPETHASRQVTEDILDQANLIFAMSREHRRAIVELNPRVSKRVFTIREFARLAQGTSAADLAAEFAPGPFGGGVDTSTIGRLKTAVAAASASRGMVPPPADPELDDVIDPYRQSQDVYNRSARELKPAVDATVQFLQTALTIEV